MTRLHSYVVARDFGFAPNPFFGFCTLATCKPNIRRAAATGDWVIGTGSKTKQRAGYLVYAMRVSEALSFGDYSHDPRFDIKRPNLYASKRRAFGDNIYQRNEEHGSWLQADSHHSLVDGTVNIHNVRRDTSENRVLVSDDFVYFGGEGPKVPMFHGENVVHVGRGHQSRFSEATVVQFVNWVRNLDETGYYGAPLDWR